MELGKYLLYQCNLQKITITEQEVVCESVAASG
jgi:hypothetical protein